MLVKAASDNFFTSSATSGLGSRVLVEQPGGASSSFTGAVFSKEKETK
jgi:hypothetical protein